MKARIKIKGALRTYLYALLYITIMLAAIAVGVTIFPEYAGILTGLAAVITFVVFLILYMTKNATVVNDLVSFATEYGQIQSKLLKELELPYVLVDDAGKIIWSNREFNELAHKKSSTGKTISSLFPEVSIDKLLNESDNSSLALEYEGREFNVKCRKISMEGLARHSELIEAEDYGGYLVAIYLFDETALKIALRENDDQSLAVALLYLDNYDEALESVEEVKKAFAYTKFYPMGNRGLNGASTVENMGWFQ